MPTQNRIVSVTNWGCEGYPIKLLRFSLFMCIKNVVNTRVRSKTRSACARGWEGNGFDARPKPRHS